MIRAIPQEAHSILLARIPRDFLWDDTKANHTILGWSFGWATLIHQWRYCTRCHEYDILGPKAKKWADLELRLNIKKYLPWYLRWVGWIFLLKYYRAGGFKRFNSCWPEEGTLCRHNMLWPGID